MGIDSGTPGYDAGSNGTDAPNIAWIDFSGTDVGASYGTLLEMLWLTTPELAFDYFSFYFASNDTTNANILYVGMH